MEGEAGGVGIPVAVRPAGPPDVDELSELAKRTWAGAFGDSLSAEDLAAELESKRSVAYFRDALRRDVILVAESNGRLLGYVQFGDVTIPEVEVRPRDQGLRRLYVDTDFHGRGIGRALLDAALAHPRLARAARIFLQVWAENPRALRLYESVGFRAVGRTRFRIGSEPVEDLVMVLERRADAPPAR